MAAGFYCVVMISATADAQTPGLDSDTRIEIANIAIARKEEMSDAMSDLRRDLLASAGRKPRLRENNAIRLDQPHLDLLLESGFQAILETPSDWEVIHDLLSGICYSYPDDRIVEFCISVLNLPVDLELVHDPSPALLNSRRAVRLALAILAQQGTPEALSVLRACVMLSLVESPRWTSSPLQRPEDDVLSSERARQYSGFALSSVFDIVASDRVVPFFQDLARSIDADFKFKRALRHYLEIAQRIEQGHPNPRNIVE